MKDSMMFHGVVAMSVILALLSLTNVVAGGTTESTSASATGFTIAVCGSDMVPGQRLVGADPGRNHEGHRSEAGCHDSQRRQATTTHDRLW